jgi:hypothetical protein
MTASRQRDQLDLYLSALGFRREVRFHPTRRWRFDWGIGLIGRNVAVEYEGGVFHGDEGHRATGRYLRDLEKYNEAALRGWTVLRFTAKEVDDGSAYGMIERAMEVAGWARGRD